MIILELSFDEQREVFIRELSKVHDYVDLQEVYEARRRMIEVNQIIEQDIPIFLMFASYAGCLLRISYYKYVHKLGFDVRALADAAVMTYMFGFVYQFEFEPYIKRKEIKIELEKTRYPKWTKIGLVGGSTREITELGEEFSQYMDKLDTA